MRKQAVSFTMIAIAIIIVILIITRGLRGANDKQVLQIIVGTHTRAFDKKNIYDEPLENDALNKWYEAIGSVKDFITNNSRKNKPQLLNYFRQIRNANDSMINAIKIAYGQIMAQEDIETVFEHVRQTFTRIDIDMQRIQKELEWVVSKVDSENQAIKTLSTLAKFISITARKAHNNLLSLIDENE